MLAKLSHSIGRSAEKQGESGKFEGERAILLVETGNLGALIGSQVLRGAESTGIPSVRGPGDSRLEK